MTWVSAVVRRIGSLDALSWPVFWVTLAAGVIGNLVTTTAAPLGARVVILGLGQLALWAPLLLARLRVRMDPARSRPALVLTAAVVGLLLRALVIGGVTAGLLGVEEVQWSQRFVGAVLNLGLAFVVGAYVVYGLRERRRQIGELAGVERALAASVAALNEEYDQRNDEALERVQAVLLTELSRLDAADPQRSLEVLQHTAADVVRPLSHQLARDRPAGASTAATSTVEVSWPDVLDQAATGRPFRPLVTAAFLAVESTAAAVAYRPGVWVYAAMLVLVVGLLAGTNLILAVVLPGRPRVTRMGLVVSMSVVIGTMGALVVWAGLGEVPARGSLVLGTFSFTVAFSLGVSVASAFTRDRDRLVRKLEDSSRNLERRAVRLRQAQWFQSKMLSRALHGPIQAAVTASALRLDAAIRAGEVDDQVVHRVRVELIDALGTLGSAEPHVTSAPEALTRLTATWEGLCEVSTVLPGDAADLLARDPVLRSCAIDIVTEAVSNAVRHGGATRAAVRIDLIRPEHDVVLAITSDSATAGAAGTRGLGSRILDDCTLEWRLMETSVGTSLSAILPADCVVSALDGHTLSVDS